MWRTLPQILESEWADHSRPIHATVTVNELPRPHHIEGVLDDGATTRAA